MRAGDRASRAPRGAVVEGMAATGAVPRTAAASTLGLLRLAIEEARPVWIGYVDTHGGVTERVVDPVRLERRLPDRVRPQVTSGCTRSPCTGSPASRPWTTRAETQQTLRRSPGILA